MARRSRLLDALGAALRALPQRGAGEHFLVAVSGGADSTALLAGLAALAPHFGYRLTAAHVAHGLRGPESERDRTAAVALGERLGVPVTVVPGPVDPGPNLEARARRARYRALSATARHLAATRIVTGHTRDDQVETVLLRLLRGRDRLGGIAAVRGPLLRPLLGATRADVRWFLAEEDLPAVVDRSNADLAHTRNRVRRLLVPLLAAEFSPQIGARLAGLADRARDEQAYLSARAAERLATLADATGLDVAVAAEPAALRRLIVARWLGSGFVRPADVERVLALAAGGTPCRHVLADGRAVTREDGRLRRASAPDAVAMPFAYPLVPGSATVGPDRRWRIVLDPPRDRVRDETLPHDAQQAMFDADALPAPLLLRSPAPGDRIHIPGVGTRKLQDLLVDAKVRRRDRWRVPVLLAGDAVVWVGGLARGSTARLTPETRRVIDARLEPAR